MGLGRGDWGDKVKVSSGQFCGRVLAAPKGLTTRPTSQRVRESMMSTVHSARGGFEGAKVLDAFAGSGALGIEALSRGALFAHFYEHAQKAYQVLCSNVASLGLRQPQVELHKTNVFQCAHRRTSITYDLVFCDPPYATDPQKVRAFIAALIRGAILESGALIVYEHGCEGVCDTRTPTQMYGCDVVRQKKYGQSVVDLWQVRREALR